jgi:hypothetical protein
VGLAEDLAAVNAPDGDVIVIPEAMLRTAVGHRSEVLRADALQLACMHPKTASMPCTSVLVRCPPHLLATAMLN